MEGYLDIYNYFGGDKQRRKLVEEVYELLESIIIYENSSVKDSVLMDHVTEEMADVLVVLTGFIAKYEIPNDKINDFMVKKVLRTKKRIVTGYYDK